MSLFLAGHLVSSNTNLQTIKDITIFEESCWDYTFGEENLKIYTDAAFPNHCAIDKLALRVTSQGLE